VNEEVTKQELDVLEEFPNEKLLAIEERSWFASMANFKAVRIIPEDLTWQQRKKFLRDAYYFMWDNPYLLMWHCHGSLYGGNFNGERTAIKILQYGFYWPTLFKDT
jgi:hypothetical protein